MPDLAPRAVDEALPGRLTAQYLRWMLTRPAIIVLLAVFVAAGAVIVFAWAVSDGDAEGPVLAVVALLMLVVVAVWIALTTRRGIRAAYPVGTQMSAQVSDDRLVTETAAGHQELTFSVLRRVYVTPHAVLLQLRGNRALAIVPRELFDDDAVARLQAGVAAAAPHKS